MEGQWSPGVKLMPLYTRSLHQEPCSSICIDSSPLWGEPWFKSSLPKLSNYQKKFTLSFFFSFKLLQGMEPIDAPMQCMSANPTGVMLKKFWNPDLHATKVTPCN